MTMLQKKQKTVLQKITQSLGNMSDWQELVLKVEKKVVELHAGLLVNALANEESQLMAVLAGSRHSDDSLKHKWEVKKKHREEWDFIFKRLMICETKIFLFDQDVFYMNI